MDALTGSPSLARGEHDRRKDDALEQRIEDVMHRMLAAQTRSLRRHWASEMTKLVAQRSPERIREMESAQGLR
jgi:hypothetical protein